MMIWLALLICFVPRVPVETDRVAMIELNHVHRESGDHVFDQMIFWELHGKRMLVLDYRMWKPGYPRVRKTPRGSTLIWCDKGTLRRVEAVSYCESWTRHDPEVSDRKNRPVRKRRLLSR